MRDMDLITDNEVLELEMEVETREYPVIPNPEGEPTEDITKMEIDDVIYGVKDASIHDWARAEEKPSYTKAEVGLGNVDNTSDLNKPVSTATQAALDLKADSSSVYTKTESDNLLSDKVDKVQGKGLSTNDYTNEAKAIVDGVTSALNGKVDKVSGYGLSKNDYSDTDKAIVDGVTSALADKVDKVEGYGLSRNDYSDEEKAKVGEIDNKLDKTENAIRSNALAIISPVNDNAPYIYRQTPVKESFKALMKKIVGASVVWNQLVDSNTTSVTIASGHRYIAKINGTLTFGTSNGSAIAVDGSRNDYFTDITSAFNTTIADYVYTLETSQSGSGISWLQSYGFFTEDYYAYNQNKLESGCVSAHKTYDGETLLTNTELSPITLRGLFKLSTNKLTVDGDEFNADGTVTRKFSIVDLGTLNWKYYGVFAGHNLFYSDDLMSTIKCSDNNKIYGICDKYIAYANEYISVLPDKAFRVRTGDGRLYINDDNYTTSEAFTTALRGVYLIYELATPTTEESTPFTETEIVGSAEEFIDYGVSQNTRDVAIPVGTDTDYYQEMKLLSLPTTSGNHNLIYNIASGFGWS